LTTAWPSRGILHAHGSTHDAHTRTSATRSNNCLCCMCCGCVGACRTHNRCRSRVRIPARRYYKYIHTYIHIIYIYIYIYICRSRVRIPARGHWGAIHDTHRLMARARAIQECAIYDCGGRTRVCPRVCRSTTHAHTCVHVHARSACVSHDCGCRTLSLIAHVDS
jgi:hypothetical protein